MLFILLRIAVWAPEFLLLQFLFSESVDRHELSLSAPDRTFRLILDWLLRYPVLDALPAKCSLALLTLQRILNDFEAYLADEECAEYFLVLDYGLSWAEIELEVVYKGLIRLLQYQLFVPAGLGSRIVNMHSLKYVLEHARVDLGVFFHFFS